MMIRDNSICTGMARSSWQNFEWTTPFIVNRPEQADEGLSILCESQSSLFEHLARLGQTTGDIVKFHGWQQGFSLNEARRARHDHKPSRFRRPRHAFCRGS